MAYLREFGCYLPSRVVTNAELAPMVGVEEAWLLQMTGIADPGLRTALGRLGAAIKRK